MAASSVGRLRAQAGLPASLPCLLLAPLRAGPVAAGCKPAPGGVLGRPLACASWPPCVLAMLGFRTAARGPGPITGSPGPGSASSPLPGDRSPPVWWLTGSLPRFLSGTIIGYPWGLAALRWPAAVVAFRFTPYEAQHHYPDGRGKRNACPHRRGHFRGAGRRDSRAAPVGQLGDQVGAGDHGRRL